MTPEEARYRAARRDVFTLKARHDAATDRAARQAMIPAILAASGELAAADQAWRIAERGAVA